MTCSGPWAPQSCHKMWPASKTQRSVRCHHQEVTVATKRLSGSGCWTKRWTQVRASGYLERSGKIWKAWIENRLNCHAKKKNPKKGCWSTHERSQSANRTDLQSLARIGSDMLLTTTIAEEFPVMLFRQISTSLSDRWLQVSLSATGFCRTVGTWSLKLSSRAKVGLQHGNLPCKKSHELVAGAIYWHLTEKTPGKDGWYDHNRLQFHHMLTAITNFIQIARSYYMPVNSVSVYVSVALMIQAWI